MNKGLAFLNLAIGLLLISATAGSAFATAPLVYRGESTLYRDTVWQGEVLIDGILTVAPGVVLEIRPGTVVRFTRYDSNGDGIGEHEIFCQGVLRALGTESQPIRFTSAEPHPAPADWGALNLMAGEEKSRLENCRVEYAYRGFHAHFAAADLLRTDFRANRRGMQFQESTVSIDRCRVVGNGNGLQFRDSEVVISRTVVLDNAWGIRGVYSTLELNDSRIEGNRVNGVNLRDSTLRAQGSRIADNRKGLYLQRSRVTVTGNVLAGNSEHGILLEESTGEVRGNRIADNGRSGVRWLDSGVTFTANSLVGNGEYALVNDGTSAAAAPANWWGASDPEAIAAAIRDRNDRPQAGEVDAAEPLTAAPPAPLLHLPRLQQERI